MLILYLKDGCLPSLLMKVVTVSFRVLISVDLFQETGSNFLLFLINK